MQMSQGGLDNLLKKFEGCKLKAYRCPAGICTIGYGHTSAAGAPTVADGMSITQAQAEEILRRDLERYETAVTILVKPDLTQNQFDVLVDFAYNAGLGNLKNSGILKKVNAAQFDAVPAELMKWNKGKIPGKGMQVLPGLVKRCQARSLWWTTHSSAPIDEQELRVTPEPIPQKTMADSKQGNAALVTAGLGSLGVAKEMAAQAKDASDTADQLMGLLSNTNFIIMLAIIGLAAGIWFWRKKHMDEHGV